MSKRAWQILAAIVLLSGLYAYADWRAVGRSLAGLDAHCLTAAMLLFVPQTIVSALRWQFLVRPLCHLSSAEAVRQTLVASAWNLVVPSKLGDLSKATMLPLGEKTRRGKAIGLVLLEKLADVAALLLWCAVGWIGWPVLAGVAVLLVIAKAHRRPSVGLPSVVLLWSLLLWSLHLLQIDFFLRAAGVVVPWSEALARIPAAIFAGLLPLTFCGLGTRDAALVWLFTDVAAAPKMAVVGMLTALRYLVPGVAGIPLAVRMNISRPPHKSMARP